MIVVSGGKGFIGSHLVQGFRGIEDVISIHSGDNLVEKPGLIEIGFNHPDLPAFLTETTTFIHAAGRISGSIEQLRHAHLSSTRRFADLLPLHIEAIIHISSVNVYISKFDAYGQIKQQAEQIWADSVYAKRTIILRCALIYGPGDYNNLYRLIALIQRWPLLLMPRAGTFRPVYIQDLVKLVAYLVEFKSRSPKLWDVSGNETVDLFQLSREIASRLPSTRIILPANRNLIIAAQAFARLLQLNTVADRFARLSISREWYNPEIWGISQLQTTPLKVGLQKTVDAYLVDKAN